MSPHQWILLGVSVLALTLAGAANASERSFVREGRNAIIRAYAPVQTVDHCARTNSRTVRCHVIYDVGNPTIQILIDTHAQATRRRNGTWKIRPA
jgi:hypothetical protein